MKWSLLKQLAVAFVLFNYLFLALFKKRMDGICLLSAHFLKVYIR